MPLSCQMHLFPPCTCDTQHCFGQLPGPCLMYVFPVEAITRSHQACPQGLTLPLTSCVTLGKALTLSGLCSPICEMGTLPPTFEDSLASYYSSRLSLSVSVPLCLCSSLRVTLCLPLSLFPVYLSFYSLFFTLSLCLWILPRTLGYSQ